jgi:multiple sugar transport system substrate-binding protein
VVVSEEEAQQVKRAALLTLTLSFFGCAGEQEATTSAGDNVVVTYWRHHNGPEKEALDTLIERFEEANPNIDIDLKTFPYNVYTTKVVAALTTDQGPNIVNIHGSWAYGYIDSGLIVPIPENVLSSEELERDFFPLVQAFRRHAAYYAIPIGGGNLGLYYNTKMFREAGISGPPRTWSELKDAARRLTIRSDDGRLLQSGASLGNLRGKGSAQLWNYFVDGVLPQAGIQQLADDARSVGWNTPQGVDAFKWFTDFARGDDAPNSIMFPSAFDSFRLGLSAMLVEGNWTVGNLATVAPELEYATAPVPTADDGTQATYGTIWGNAVTRSTSGATQAAAWKFLRFVSQYENMLYWSKTTGELPVRAQVLDDSDFLESAAPLHPFITQMSFARMSLKKDEGRYKTAIIDAADEVLLNNTPPSAALAEAAQRINSMLEER